MRFALQVLQGFSIALLALIVVTFILAILGKLGWNAFWVTAAIVAALAYLVIPRIRKVLLRQ